MAPTLDLTMAVTPPKPAHAIAEPALVARARRGDHGAFEALVRQHKDGVLGLARRIVGDPDAAHDVAQEAFIKAYRKLPEFRGKSAFSTWLYRIAVNEARVYLRSRRRGRARWERQRDEFASQLAAERPPPDAGSLVALMQELPENQRVALALHYMGELSLEQIAATVGSPTGTIKARLSRGREKLRDLAKERGLV